ncbi:MAG: hypothetical protein RLZZ223_212 [Candidatus Parcubacteria bacterium]|jgi:hypothetical protein
MNIYRKFFKQNLFFLAIIVVIGVSVGLAITKLMPVSYDVSLALNIERKTNDTGQFYTYDGYYAIQATELFGKSVASWFVTPDFVEDVLRNADKSDINKLSVKDFRRVFTPEQVSASVVEVRFGVKEVELGATLTDSISSSISSYMDTRGIKDYNIFVGTPVIRKVDYNPLLFALGSGLLALALGISVAAIKQHYWKK